MNREYIARQLPGFRVDARGSSLEDFVFFGDFPRISRWIRTMRAPVMRQRLGNIQWHYATPGARS
jgi:hypothetical protein